MHGGKLVLYHGMEQAITGGRAVVDNKINLFIQFSVFNSSSGCAAATAVPCSTNAVDGP